MSVPVLTPGSAVVFVAGATGAIGFPLVVALVERGWRVVGTTRKREGAERLRVVGVIPEVVDVYDRGALTACVRRHDPAVVIHQLTDLPYGVPREQMAEAIERNNRIRLIGTRHLLDAVGDTPLRLIVQSIAFMYADGPIPHREDDPLSSPALESFERMVLDSPHDCTVLRYGRFYGERTGVDRVSLPCRVNVTAAVHATLLAIEPMAHRVYNVCEDAEYADPGRFVAETSWTAAAP
ncbi:MAG: NAD(P)-dependent oxidoreductase [Acidobacteria bacterium]|nr:NAD(P)-dependent oxidoreductase [Acidobacteriota bacterium]